MPNNKIKVSLTINPEVHKQFKKNCEVGGYKMSTLTERLWEEWSKYQEEDANP